MWLVLLKHYNGKTKTVRMPGGLSEPEALRMACVKTGQYWRALKAERGADQMTTVKMKVTYTATIYKPELVTGRYVRCEGRKGSYMFKVFETATCLARGSRYGKPGMGPTLREYITDGAEIPEEVKLRCIASKTTEKWD